MLVGRRMEDHLGMVVLEYHIQAVKVTNIGDDRVNGKRREILFDIQ